MMDFDPREPAPQRPQSRTPPLFATLHRAYVEGREGTIFVKDAHGSHAVFVQGGRVVNLTHPAVSIQAVLDLLTRSGLIGPSDIAAAGRYARREDLPLEEALVRAGRVSAGTLSNAREMLFRETLLDLALARDLEVTPNWTAPRTSREVCALPVPFLLKEAQRRAQELQGIREAVPSPELVFTRTAVAAENRWEELNLRANERQVFFFVDGRRTVTDVALATCQAEHDVMRALKSLVDAGMVRRGAPASPMMFLQRVGRSALVRTLALLAAAAGLVLVTAAGVSVNAARPRVTGPDPYHTVVAAGPEDRLLGAMRLFRTVFGSRPDFQDLLAEGLVLPSDARAAATFRVGDGYLLTDPDAPPPAPRPGQEGNAQDRR